jgi:putative hydrolase of the HAD superfamily
VDKLNPKAVIFDLGSTLIEYPSERWEEITRECVESSRRLLVAEGHAVPETEAFHTSFVTIRDECRVRAAETLEEWTVPALTTRLLESLGVAVEDGLIDRVFDAFYEPFGVHPYPLPDAEETLKRLADRYEAVGLVSNTVFPDRAHLGELERFGLLPYLKFHIFSSSFGRRKPHPDIFRAAANRAGFAPAECVYVGDRYLEDITGPEGVGMPAVLKWHSHREYPPDMPETVRTIRSLSELSQHISL